MRRNDSHTGKREVSRAGREESVGPAVGSQSFLTEKRGLSVANKAGKPSSPVPSGATRTSSFCPPCSQNWEPGY